MLTEFIRHLVLFLSLNVPDAEARELAADVTIEQTAAMCDVLRVGDPDPLDPWIKWATEPAIYEKPGCTAVAGSSRCRGATCSVKCADRRCCTKVWDEAARRYVERCTVEMDPSTCVAQPFVPAPIR